MILSCWMHGREALINYQEVDSVEIKGSVYSLDWTTGLARIKLVPNIFTVDPDIRIQYQSNPPQYRGLQVPCQQTAQL